MGSGTTTGFGAPVLGWSDMSPYVVHFTKTWDKGDEYSRLWTIVTEERVEPGPEPFGAARGIPGILESQRSACFSEVPLDQLGRLVSRRSSFGLAFRKELLVSRGGAPVWYLGIDGPTADAFKEMLRSASASPKRDSPLWKITPFVDFPGDYPTGSYRFEWEREWRVPGGFTFDVVDIEFVFLPEAKHKAARRSTFKHLRARLIDPTWPRDRIQAELPDLRLPLT
jgi:hypothetical protein